MEPFYTHDCARCTFLGHSGTADLYFCDQEVERGTPLKTVIARFSSDGPDYISGLAFAQSNHELMEAKRLATELGLL